MEQRKKILEECGPCPIFAGFTLAFALQLRKKKIYNADYILSILHG